MATQTRIEDRSQALLHMASPEEFFRHYWPRLLRFLISQAWDSSLAEDVAADTFMTVLDNWDKLLTYERPDSWLFKVAIRKLRRLEAQTRAQGQLAEDLAISEEDLRLAAAADKWVEDHLDLVAAMRTLPRRQSEVIALKWLADLTVNETAQILGVTEGTVKQQLSRAIGKLRVLLENPGVAPVRIKAVRSSWHPSHAAAASIDPAGSA
jgi:RNA polymerase sigma factor (sigma-70 family)